MYPKIIYFDDKLNFVKGKEHFDVLKKFGNKKKYVIFEKSKRTIVLNPKKYKYII